MLRRRGPLAPHRPNPYRRLGGRGRLESVTRRTEGLRKESIHWAKNLRLSKLLHERPKRFFKYPTRTASLTKTPFAEVQLCFLEGMVLVCVNDGRDPYRTTD